jgi:hypothetical protein
MSGAADKVSSQVKTNLSWSVEAMHWVFYLFIGHDTSYWEHFAKHG